MDTPPGYVEIDRRFSVLDGAPSFEESASQSYLLDSNGPSEALGWDELLKEHLVVILGEPGSGKSWEFRHRCAVLRERDAFVFLIVLERLVSGTFTDVLSPSDRKRFRQWEESNQPAHFFLDSVDEAKLHRQSDFYAALDKIRDAIEPNAARRAHMVISSRISEWHPETDRREVLSRFGTFRPREDRAAKTDATETRSAAASVLIVQMEPLDRERVREFVVGRGMTNPEQFIVELDTHWAWEFARRPIDVFDLAEYWNANGRLGSLTEIIEHDVTTKLKETTERHVQFPLSEGQARAGAEALAAATVFCARQQFKVPDDAFLAPNAIDAARCLPEDWCPVDTKALLSRPLFDSATYGQIRFHHRRVSEYLAAAWLRRRMAEGCPTYVLLQLLFDDSHGRKVSRQSRIPVTAWLCAGNDRWNGEVRAWVLEASPEILLQYGDASALPIDYRRSLLRAWIARNADRKKVYVQTSHDALCRLAAPALADDISAMLAEDSTSVDVRGELVQLVRFGKLVGCLPTLVAILSSATEPEDLKGYALAAIRDMGTPDVCRQVWEILRTLPTLPGGICATACEAMYPGTIGPVDFVALLQITLAGSERVSSFAWRIERHLKEHLPSDHCGTLVAELNRLLQQAPHISVSNRGTRISHRFEWILDILPTVLAKLLAHASLTEAECNAVAEALSILGESQRFHHDHTGHVKKLNALTHVHPELRRAYFWLSVTRWRSENAEQNPHLYHVFGSSSVLEPAESDLQWMISDIQSMPRHEDRDLALRLAMRLDGVCGRWSMRRLRQAVNGDAVLAAVLNAARSDYRWAWLRSFYYRWTNGPEWKHWWIMRKHALGLWWSGCLDTWFLWRRLGALRSGKAIGILSHLCREADEGRSKWAPATWGALVTKRGRTIANAAKSGCKRAWCHFVPLLPHEKARSNEVGADVVVGLAGIQAMFVDGELRCESLSDDDARRATRYAVNEMNGFPNWFAGLAAAKPVPVGEVLTECVRGEWYYPVEREIANDVLADLAWEGGPLARLVRPAVLDNLGKGDPVHPAIFDAAMSLVLKTVAIPDVSLARIAAERCSVAPIDSANFALWCAAWLQLDAAPAISLLGKRLRECATPDAVILSICSLLEGGVRQRLPLLSRPTYLNPSALQHLILLVYRHVRPAEDIDHQGPYTPDTRDEAARFRNGLLMRLAQSEDPSGTARLQELLGENDLAGQRDWILHLLDERHMKNADSCAWDPTDIRVFTRDHETDPKIARDLFGIVVRRLIDIRNDIERSDNSLREEVRVGAEEYVLRRWLARKLNERSRQRYTIPQEEEIDQEQRPDLRAENPKTGSVSIEVKWADNWTIAQLFAGLETQLVGQYLRAHHSRHGIYVLGVDGRQKKHWQSDDGRNLTFNEVKDLLDARARELTASNDGIDMVCVISIDFRVAPES